MYRSRFSVISLVAVFILSLASVAGAQERGQSEERRPDNPGEQAEEHRQNEDAQAQQPQTPAPQAESQGRSGEAPHGNAYGHDKEPGEPAQPPARDNAGNGNGTAAAQADDEENIPSGNKGSVKVRSHGADPYPPRNEPHVDCIFDVLFYGFASSGATATIATHAPTSPTGTQVAGGQSVTWEPAQRQGNEYIDRVTFDLRGVIDNGDFTYHPQQGYHLKLTVTNPDRENGNVKHKVFWVNCPPVEGAVDAEDEVDAEGAVLGVTGERDEELVEALAAWRQVEQDALVLGVAVEADEVVTEEDEADTMVLGVVAERGDAAVAAVTLADEPAAVAGERPAAALAMTGIGLLALLGLGLLSMGGGIGALRLSRK